MFVVIVIEIQLRGVMAHVTPQDTPLDIPGSGDVLLMSLPDNLSSGPPLHFTVPCSVDAKLDLAHVQWCAGLPALRK